jgi:hypothetical protein
LEGGLATGEDLERVSKSWKEWGEDQDAWLSIPNAEILSFKK